MAELPEIVENTCGIENTEIPMEDTAIAFVTPTPDQHSYEGSLALMSGPKYTDSDTNCLLKFWYFYYTEDEDATPLVPSIRHLDEELESVLDNLGPTGEAGWKQASIGLGRQYYRFQVKLFNIGSIIMFVFIYMKHY